MMASQDKIICKARYHIQFTNELYKAWKAVFPNVAQAFEEEQLTDETEKVKNIKTDTKSKTEVQQELLGENENLKKCKKKL